MNVWLDLAKEYKLSIILGIWSIILWIWFFILWEPSVTPWIPPIIITIVVVITGLLSLIYSAWNSKKDNNGHPSKLRHEKWFYIWIIEIALLGGTWAFFLPLAINSSFGQDDGAALRQALIYTTGGVLGVITLGETHRKNTLEKTKNEQDHTRQVHAERRARYAKAVEQLADEKAPIRLGGAYTLVKLVDDWLDDEKTLPSEDERRQEGQIIVNSLCAYIRSSFPLAERHDELTLSYEEYQQKYQDNQGKNQATQSVENSADNSTPKPEEHQDNKQSREDFVRDKSIFREEQEVRQTILSEIEKRLNSNKDKDEDGKGEVKPGTWSYFEYDFSNTVFFYYARFSYSYFGNPSNFSGATFTQGAKFSRATFQDTCFYEATFTQNADFFRATFQDANFYEATFTQNADFSGVTFVKNVDFSEAIFQNKPIFEYTLSNKTYKVRFLYKEDDPRNYNFEVSPDSPYKFETEKHLSPDRTIITIPKGCIVLNPLLTKISISDDSIKGISVKGVSANGVPQVEKKLKLKMSPWKKKKKKSKATYWTIYSLITFGITVFGGIIVWSMTQHHDSKPDNTVSQPVASASTSTGTTQSPQVTVSPSPSSSYTLSPSSTYSGEASSTTSLNSPVPATRPEGSPPGRISVEFDDAPSSGEKIGRDKYQISSSGHVGLRVGWSSISYNNTVSSNDCEVVLTSSGPAPVKGEIRTAKCTDTYGTSLEFSEPGEYTISVEDKQSGNTGSRVIQIVK